MATKPPVKQVVMSQTSELTRTIDDSEEEIQVRAHRSSSSPSHDPLIPLQTLLLSSKTDEDIGKAHDLIASLLTRHRGEYVFRIGALPPLSQLVSGEPIEDTGWIGVTRTQAEVDKLHEMTAKGVEQMGGKVSTLFESRTNHPRIHLLLRLPPLNISDIPEVRCAVVGNVDSGKSTTLGVLTRGMFLYLWPHLLFSYRQKVRLMTEEGGLVLHFSDTNTRSRAEGLPALGWRSDFVLTAVRPFR
jgi:hypothetical protein